MSQKLFVKSGHINTSTEICAREMVQQVIEQCLTFIDESDVLHNTMACGQLGYYIQFKAKLIIPSAVSSNFTITNASSISNSGSKYQGEYNAYTTLNILRVTMMLQTFSASIEYIWKHIKQDTCQDKLRKVLEQPYNNDHQ